METKTFFDTNRDIQQFMPNLSTKLDVNLNDLVIKDNGANFTDNGIGEHSQVLGLITDPFEAMEAKSFLHRSLAKAQESSNNNQSQP